MSKLEDVGVNLATGALVAVFMWVLVVLLALPTMWLWNWLMPTLFNLPTVTLAGSGIEPSVHDSTQTDSDWQ